MFDAKFGCTRSKIIDGWDFAMNSTVGARNTPQTP